MSIKDSSRPPAAAVANPFGRIEPNSAACRARKAGFGEYVDCLVSPHLMCSCALQFGDGRLCLHPARAEIVARTPSASPVFSSTDDSGPISDSASS